MPHPIVRNTRIPFTMKRSRTSAHSATIQVPILTIWKITCSPTLARGLKSVRSVTIHAKPQLALKVTSRYILMGKSHIDASYVPFHQIIWRHTNRLIILRRCFGIFTLWEVLIFSYIFLRGWREFSKEFVSVHTSIVKHISMFVLTTHPMFTDEASKDSACAHICGQIRQHGQCVQIPLDHGVHYTVSGSHQGL